MIVAVDFDGTIVEHRFPEIGRAVPDAIAWLREFQRAGAKLILFTMRSDQRSDGVGPEGKGADRDYLREAVEWCEARGLRFWGVNENPDQRSWTDSPKPYAHVYIDDASLGCPLRPAFQSARPMVDWARAGPAVLEMIQARKGAG